MAERVPSVGSGVSLAFSRVLQMRGLNRGKRLMCEVRTKRAGSPESLNCPLGALALRFGEVHVPSNLHWNLPLTCSPASLPFLAHF